MAGAPVLDHDDLETGLMPALERIFLDDDFKGLKTVLGTQVFLHALVIVAVVLLFRELALGVKAKKYPELFFDEPARQDTYTFYDPQEIYNRVDSYYGHNGYQPRSLGDNKSFLSRVINSIDPVESTFSLLNVEQRACRRRTVCELQRAASKFPLLGTLVKFVSPSIKGLDEYREAQDAGAALEDCALLFSECPTSLVQSIWGREDTE